MKINLQKLFFNRYSMISIISVCISLFLYFYHGNSLYALHWKYFSAFFIISFFFWTGVGNLMKVLPRKVVLFFNIGISFYFIITLVTSFGFYFEFKEFLSNSMVFFLREQPVYFYGYLNQVLNSPLQIGAILISTTIGVLLFNSKKLPLERKSIYKFLGFFFISTMICNISLNKLKHAYQKQFIQLDIHNFYSLRSGLKTKSKIIKPLKHYVSPFSENLLSDTSKKWNIVVVVFESLSREPLSFYNHENSFTPFMDSWIKDEKEQFVLMQNAISNSGATDASMPVIFTGVGPEEAYSKLVSAPFLWDFAKAKGLETFYATSQSNTWASMNVFIEDKHLDHYYYPEKLGMPFINDLGTDDLVMMDTLATHFKKTINPFFIFYNTNATHVPYQDTSVNLEGFNDIKLRYGKALYITDKSVEKIVDMVKEKNEMDNTIFIFTADHGAHTVKRRSRLASFFKETLDIPIMIRFPKEWISKYPTKLNNLKANSQKLVSNLDIVPTIFELMFPNASNEEYQYKGTSLLDSIDSSRYITCLSNNDRRHYHSSGFGIYKEGESFIFHDNTGFHFYNIKKDPMQKKNLIKSITPKKRKLYDSIVSNNKFLDRVYQKYK